MLKRLVFLLIFSLIICGFIFAEETDAFPRNTITASTSFFGVGAQYEFQLNDAFSIGGRFEYKEIGKYSSWTVQGFGRYYPFTGTFFIDGMAGYSNLIISDNPITHHLNLYGRVGWRIDFGKPGGLTLEPTIGFFGLIGDNHIPSLNLQPSSWNWFTNLALLGEAFTRMVFSGGPVFTIGLGYRF
ncbi:MAG: hypothetical protein FWD28_01180 [Treponema sp.]|nr:hypothetical protein [Treponema sp.]